MDGSGEERISSYLDWSDKGNPAIWRYILAVVLGFIFWMWGSIPAVLLLKRYIDDPKYQGTAFEYTFVIGFIAIPLIVRYLLKRPAYSVALPSWPVRTNDYFIGVLIGWVCMIIMYLMAARIEYRGFEHITAGIIPLILLTLLGVFIQTGFEELYFRGLITQATRRLTAFLPIVIGVQAIYFASLHVGNIKEWGNGYLAMLPYLVTALAWGWIAWRTGSLVFPSALHFANNAFLILFINTKGDVIQSVAPFVAETPSIERATIFGIGQNILMVIAIELLLRWRARK